MSPIGTDESRELARKSWTPEIRPKGPDEGYTTPSLGVKHDPECVDQQNLEAKP